jgi:hypothetical protein
MDHYGLDNRVWCMNVHLMHMEAQRQAALLPPPPITKWTKYQKFGRKVGSEVVGFACFGIVFSAVVMLLHGFDDRRLQRSGRFIGSAFRGGHDTIQEMVKRVSGKVNDKEIGSAVPIMTAQLDNLKPEPKPKMEPKAKTKHREG